MPVSFLTERTLQARVLLVFLGGLALLSGSLLVLPLLGPVRLNLSDALAGKKPDFEILFHLRLPRVLLGAIAGGGLATAGVLFQALLRDALASPYTLGVTSGAALGAVIAIWAGWQHVFYLPAIWVCAYLGAATVLVAVMRLASERGRLSSFTLLLAGVTMNSICLALLLLLHNLPTIGQSFSILRWLMGGIEPASYRLIALLGSFVLVLTAAAYRRSREWNTLAVGEVWAQARGVNTQRLLREGYLIGSLLAGSITAFTGPIGFVGLIVPHALRLIVGADHRLLIPGAFFVGAAFLAICDAAARTLLAPVEIPVGVVTAILGGPFFIWLLRSKKRSLWL